MQPVEIPDHDLYLRDGMEATRVTFGAEQPEYRPLPSVRLPGVTGQVLTRWQPSQEERQAIADGASIDLALCTFGGPLQPVILGVAGLTYVAPELIPPAELLAALEAESEAEGG